MMKSVFLVAAVALAASVPAASSAAAPKGGTIVITASNADGAPVPAAFLEAASRTLNAKGFTILGDPEHVGYLAQLTVSQDNVGTAMEKDRRESIGMAGSGAYLPLKSGGYTASALRRTRLEIRISQRGGGVVWHGDAVTVRAAGTPKGSNAAVAQDLSATLLSGYPEQPEDTVGVP
jgi:opacity protein-like surface antigen